MTGVSPLIASVSRWALIVLIVFAAAFATNKSHGADNATALWQSVIVAAPVALGALDC